MVDLYFSKNDIEKLKKSTDKRLQKMIEDVIKVAQSALEIKALSEDKVSCDDARSGNIHENYYEASVPFKKNMIYLAFGYHYTNDERYFKKARELMLTYSTYKKWYGKGWHGRSELNTSHFCLGMAYGYAAFEDMLTQEELNIIVEATYRLGICPTMEDWILPGAKIHALDTMGHNWWLVCICCAGTAAAVMKDAMPENKYYAEIAASGAEKWFAYKGNPINVKPLNIDNGGYYEGISYYNMSIDDYLLFRRAYKKQFNRIPFNDQKILTGAAGFFAKTLYPSDVEDYSIRFGDAPGKGIMKSALRMAGEEIECSELLWYIQNCTHRETDILDVVFYKNIYEKKGHAPFEKSVFYEKIGWAIFRDSYKKNGTMLAIKCGDTWNHAHADAGHFEFYKNGVAEIYDSGTCDYGHELYVDYYIQSNAHNVVLFNGKGQDERDRLSHVRMTGKLHNFIDNDGFKYVAADMTGPMGRYFRRHLRHFLWLDKFILIYDDIECYEHGELSFLLHAQNNNSFKMLTPCEYSKCHLKDSKEQEFYYSCYNLRTDENCRAKFVSVILLDDKDEPKLSETMDTIKVECKDTYAYINILSDGRIMHRNCLNVLGGYLTDAVILTLSNGKVGVVNGSIVRHDDEIILDVLERVNGIVKKP